MCKRCELEARTQGWRGQKASVGNKALLEGPQRISAKGGGSSGRPAGRPYKETDRMATQKQRPPIPWKPRRLMIFARGALGFGPGNAANFPLALAYLAKSEGGQVHGSFAVGPCAPSLFAL